MTLPVMHNATVIVSVAVIGDDRRVIFQEIMSRVRDHMIPFNLDVFIAFGRALHMIEA